MMRFLNLILLVAALFSCSGKDKQAEQSQAGETFVSETISPFEFQRRLKVAQDPVILDVRTPEERETGYIEGSVNIDFRSSNFQSEVEKLDKNKVYFLYCAGGGRSGKATDLMHDLQFKELYNLDGGFTAWKSSGYPVEAKLE